MRKDRSAKSRRQTVALKNLRSRLTQLKSARTDTDISNLLSTKDKKKIQGPHEWDAIRKSKIAFTENQIAILEKRV